MKLQSFMHVTAVSVLLCTGLFSDPQTATAQVIDFGQIESFETLGTGTQRGGSPPKTIVDDGEWHTVMFTILDSNAEAKIYWRSPDGPQTMIIHGRSVKAFQTAGEFKIEALGDATRSFKYGYVQFRLKGNKGT
ncbi:MAG: hypothetical protein WA645_05810 [Pseudolabrys sp.]